MEYYLLTDNDLLNFESAVNKYVEDGWNLNPAGFSTVWTGGILLFRAKT